MKTLFAAVLGLLVLTSNAMAAPKGITIDSVKSAGFDRLSNAEKADLLKTVAERATTAPAPPAAEDVEKWVTISANIGKGLAGAARELGVAVNEFAATDVGKLTAALIVWHIMGGTLIHVFGGVFIIVVGCYVLRYCINRTYPNTVVYSTTQKNIFGNYAIERVTATKMSGDDAGGWVVAYFVVFAVGLIAIFTF